MGVRPHRELDTIVRCNMGRAGTVSRVPSGRNQSDCDGLPTITGSGSAQAPVAERPVVLPPVIRRGARMIAHPAHILPSLLDTSDPNFPAQCAAWTDQMRSEIKEAVALTRKTITSSKLLMDEADRLLALR